MDASSGGGAGAPPSARDAREAQAREAQAREAREARDAREAEQAREEPREGSLGAAAALLAGSVVLSRVLGYARDVALTYTIGAGPQTDAYFAAFQIPDILNYLLSGGAFSIAFIPLYTRRRAGGDEAGAERLLATVLGTTTAVAALATAVLFAFADGLVALQFDGFDADTQARTVRLTRIVLPAQIFFLSGSVVNAALMARGRFLAQALAPLVYNACIIAGGLLFATQIGVDGFAWGVLAGAVAGPFLAPLIHARGRIRLRVRVAPLDRDYLRYLAVAAPLMLGLGLLTLDEWYLKWFGAGVGEASVSYLSYAHRLAQAPVGVIGQALGAALLPVLSQLHAEGRREALDATLLRTLQAALALALLTAAAVCAFARPAVELLFLRGAFTSGDAAAVARVLAIYAFWIPAAVLLQIAARSFYARGDTWKPALLASGFALAAVPVYLELARRHGATGIALAGVIGLGANALTTLLVGRLVHGAPALGRLFASALRAVAIAMPSALAGVLAASRARAPAERWLEGAPPSLVGGAELLAGGLVFAAVAAAGIFLLGDRELRDALRRLVPRRRRASPPGGA